MHWPAPQRRRYGRIFMSRINKHVGHTVYLGQGGIGDKLVIGTAGDIYPSNAGPGVVSDVSGGKIINHGTVTGGFGGSQGAAVGGTGIELEAKGTVSNSGTVTGGYGAQYFVGGVGIDLAAGGQVTN